ncbi:MAG: hypothetical protein ABH811_00775 [archaeon]
MLKKLLKESVIIVVGKQSGEIFEFLDTKKYLSEFLIAKKMDITVNQVRNILYRLADNGLVLFTRKKDKKKGWYTYSWKIEILKSLEFLKDVFRKEIERIKYQVKSRQNKNFYLCERCKIEFNEENALFHNFTCDECGDIFVLKDNSSLLKECNRDLDKLNNKLKLVEEEIQKEMKLLNAKKIRIIKKEEKEKKMKREAKRKMTKKKSPKKPIKKKIKKKVSKKVTKKKIKKIPLKKPKKKIPKKK